ncbi:MAG: penicillin-binding protein 2 [Proteobacteria bacterium]|nr:penicillin-binding protein 2 [Pseudomonadota bacterium]
MRPAPEAVRIEGQAKEAIETGRTRLLVGFGLFALAFLAIAARLVEVSVLAPGAGRPLVAAVDPAPPIVTRGDIVDRNGLVLATSLPTASLYADPASVIDAGEAARALAQALPGLRQAELSAKLGQPGRFVWIKRHLTPREQYEVNRLGIPGLHFLRSEKRAYPQGRMAAHVLGAVDIDNIGIAGVERTFEETLGASERLSLSLDLRVQHVLAQELARAMARFQAAGAAGLIMDADTGEVVALVSLPDFSPERLAGADQDALFNRATLGVYEMGSTFKLFTAALVLDFGVATLRSGFDAREPIRVARFTIRDYKPKRRRLTLPEVLVYSSNIGAARMALEAGGARQRAFLGRLGLLDPATIELPEVGQPLSPSPWREINTMTVGFGHGVAVSPLQLAAAVAALVNGGLLPTPTLVKREDGRPAKAVRVIRKETSDTMRRLMRLVVTRGTGKAADVPGYLVGGKTGSAEKIEGRGYREGALLSSFVGAFPIHAPRYVVLAILDEPKGRPETHGYATGGWVAAPVVAATVARVAPMLGVRPVDERDPGIRAALDLDLSPPPAEGAARVADLSSPAEAPAGAKTGRAPIPGASPRIKSPGARLASF